MAERTVGLPADVDVGALGVALLEAAHGARIGIAIATIDPTGPRLLYANDAVADIIGWPLDEMLEGNPMRFVAPEATERVYARFARRAQGETGQMSYELTVIRKDGTRVPIELTASRATLGGR